MSKWFEEKCFRFTIIWLSLSLISTFLGTEVEPMLIITENAYEKLVKVTRFKLEEDESFLVDEEEDENNV